MILLLTGAAMIAMAVFWGVTLTSGGLLILASVAISNADVHPGLRIAAFLVAGLAGLGVSWLAEAMQSRIHGPRREAVVAQ